MTDGSSRRLCFLGLGSIRLDDHRFLAYLAEVNLAQRFVGLMTCALQHTAASARLYWLSGLWTLLVLLLTKELLGVGTQGGILLESLNERSVLTLIELVAKIRFDLAQFALLLQEFNCRLHSYV